ncbi:MAG TPA: FimV/HubP family polar landmark protein, partial [Noviherbaspirillum sp.]|nr:FimV/HubP family polar landmark protein [Noviherbaspirillum sp.]
MHSDKRAPLAGFSRKTLSAAVVSALLVSNAFAAGLGRMTVLSSLGQPLRAEIELTAVSKDEIGALAAKLASSEAFRQANIDFNAALLSLRFNVENRGDRHFIRVTSSQPLNEPFVDMLLELSGPNGRLIREYTFLLDPPDLRMTQSASVAPAPVPQLGSAGTQQAAAVSQQPGTAAPRAAAVPSASRAASPAAGAEAGVTDYQVRQGDTLTQIAGRVKPAHVSLDQMVVALYQSNQDAFDEKNMNRLKAGQILNVPDAETAAAVEPAAARSIIIAQAADFNAYRQRLAGQVASASARRAGEARQAAGGQITARVEERAGPASASPDRLQLSHATADGAGNVTAEDLIARDKALAEAQARVKELERNVSDLQKLLELKNASLAEQQNQAEAARSGATPEPAAPVAAAAPAAAPEPVQADAAPTPGSAAPAPVA